MIRQGRYTKKVSKVRRARRTSRRFIRWFKKLSKKKKVLLISTPILVFLVLTPLLTYLYYFNDISDQERLMNRNNTGIALTDKNGITFYSVGRAQHRQLVPLSDIPVVMQHALVASEDKDFYQHQGFSVNGIIRSLYNNVISGQVTGGGSTLTQQLAKNTLLTQDQNILRKYQELAISVAIEQRYSKDQIMDMYLNSVFFGGTSFGIEDAAKSFFNKNPKDLDLAQSAMLVGVLPAPNLYSPIVGDQTLAKKRQTTVLSRMVTNGYITDTQKQAALVEQLTYAAQQNINDSQAPHFAQMVIQQLNNKYGEEKVLRSGYQVRTTLDLNLQHTLESQIINHVVYIQRNGGSNIGADAIDPASGEVRALVGSVDWKNPDWGKVNMATTPRQPGSSFKPIYYSEALASGVITPATILQDVPTDFNGYRPQNASRTYSGNITVRNALSRSLNIPSVEVMQKLGIDKAITAAKRMGVTTLDANANYGLSLALGSAEVPLIQMTNVYAAFANQGNQYTLSIIQQIDDKFSSTIFKTQEHSRSVINPEGAFLISSILSDNTARAPIFGSSLTVSGRTAAVKTGTTDDQRDAWTIGYTPQLAVGIWVGNNNNAAMINGGSGMAGPIWVGTMKQALSGVPNTPFPIPSDVIQKSVCYGSGALASSSGKGTYNEYFLASALPSDTCSLIQDQPQVDNKPTDNTSTQKTTPNVTPSSGGDGTGSSGTTTPVNSSTTPQAGTGSGVPAPNNNGTGNGSTPSIPPVIPPHTP